MSTSGQPADDGTGQSADGGTALDAIKLPSQRSGESSEREDAADQAQGGNDHATEDQAPAEGEAASGTGQSPDEETPTSTGEEADSSLQPSAEDFLIAQPEDSSSSESEVMSTDYSTSHPHAAAMALPVPGLAEPHPGLSAETDATHAEAESAHVEPTDATIPDQADVPQIDPTQPESLRDLALSDSPQLASPQQNTPQTSPAPNDLLPSDSEDGQTDSVTSAGIPGLADESIGPIAAEPVPEATIASVDPVVPVPALDTPASDGVSQWFATDSADQPPTLDVAADQALMDPSAARLAADHLAAGIDPPPQPTSPAVSPERHALEEAAFEPVPAVPPQPGATVPVAPPPLPGTPTDNAAAPPPLPPPMLTPDATAPVTLPNPALSTTSTMDPITSTDASARLIRHLVRSQQDAPEPVQPEPDAAAAQPAEAAQWPTPEQASALQTETHAAATDSTAAQPAPSPEPTAAAVPSDSSPTQAAAPTPSVPTQQPRYSAAALAELLTGYGPTINSAEPLPAPPVLDTQLPQPNSTSAPPPPLPMQHAPGGGLPMPAGTPGYGYPAAGTPAPGFPGIQPGGYGAAPGTSPTGVLTVGQPQQRSGFTSAMKGIPLPALVAGIGLGIVLLVAGWLIARSISGKPEAAPAAETITSVSAAHIDATASSTQKTNGKITYDAKNTLDGRLDTAWNSNGSNSTNPGVFLTYSFASPTDIRTMTIRNGYQKMLGKLDLYKMNARPHTIRITTDKGTWTKDLKDSPNPQVLTERFGPTTTMRIDVVSIYKGTKYTDVALSEVAFTAAQ